MVERTERPLSGLDCTVVSKPHFGVQLMPAPSMMSDQRSVAGLAPGMTTFWSEKRRRWAMPKRAASAPVSASRKRVVAPTVSMLLSAMRS
ncbi:hypothetical protein D3C72_2242910 [compost metagenome]